MAETEGQERSEQPTQKRLNEAREKGQVAKSIEVNSFAVFGTGLLMIFITQKFIGDQIARYSTQIFNSLDILTVNKNTVQNFAKETFFFFIVTIAPVIGAIFVIAIVAGIAQAGLKFSFKSLSPKFEKFNPFKGIKNVLISSRSLVEVLKSLLKLLIIGGFTYSVLSDLILKSPVLAQLSISEIVAYLMKSAGKLLWKISILYALIAAVDFIYQKYKYKKNLMMTKQEVKEETKQTEGDPQIKGRIRRLQFQAAKSRMMKNVPKADVVITNPTHYAVALRYDMQKDAAPMVVAKGVDELAQRIKTIAVENGIPLHEDRELARALYKVCDIGEEIPSKLFKAVAQILAYVYKLKTQKKKSIV